MILEVSTDLITFLGVLIALVTLIVIYKQLREMQKASLGDFLLRLQDEFFWRKSNANILICIEKNKKILEKNKGKISETDLDNYLGYIELISFYVKQKILNEKIVNHLFGYYIMRTYSNKEVSAHVESCRKLAGADLYSGLEFLGKRLLKKK